VDGANQAEPAAPFSWKRLTQSKVERWIQGKSFDLLVGSHDGYQRLAQPVTHRRWVVSLKNGIYLVRDVIRGQGKHRLDLAWHLGQDLQLVAEGVFRVKGASHGLAVLPAKGQGWAEEVVRESWSPVYGQKAPMTTLTFSAETALPAEFTTLLVTLEEASGRAASFARIETAAEDSAAGGYKYSGDDVEYSFIFGERGKPWHLGSLSSDAEFVCWKRKPGSTDAQLILRGGSYARVDGGAELRCTRPVEWAELVVSGDRRTVFSSDMEAVAEKIVALGQPETPIPNPE